MPDEEREERGPSLEMPSLGGLFRRRGRADAEPDRPAAHPADAPAVDPEADPRAELEPEAPPLFADEVAGDDEVTVEAPTAAETTSTRVQTAVAADPSEDADEPPAEGGSRVARRGPVLAGVPDRLAALVTGALVGLLGVGLTYVGLLGCEAWRGTQACGGPGLLFLALILVAMVTVGAFFLRAAGIADATSTSVLAVGVVAVVCLLVLIDALFSPWMLVVLPLVGALAYAGSHWVTATYGSTAPRD